MTETATTILVVDREAGPHGSQVDFTAQNRWRILHAASGRQALLLLEQESPDLAVVNIQLHGLDGRAFLEAAHRRQPDLEFLLCSDRDIPAELLQPPYVSSQVITTPLADSARLEAAILRSLSATPAPETAGQAPNEQEHLIRLRYLENVARIDQVIRQANGIDQMMSDALENALDIFQCDRAWLRYPGDPGGDTQPSHLVHARTRAGDLATSTEEAPVDPADRRLAQIILQANAPVGFGSNNEHPCPDHLTAAHGVRAQLATAIRPGTGQPWAFALQQCSRDRDWSDEERHLLHEIGRHLEDALRRLHTLRELQNSEEYLRNILETEPECVKILDPDGTLVSMNRAGLAMIEVDSLDAVKGDSILPFINREFRRNFKALVDRVCQKGENATLTFRITGARGTSRWLESHAVPHRDSQGKITGLLAITRDITEHRLALAAARSSEEKFRSLVESSSDWIWEVDATGVYTYVSPQVEEILGYRPQEIIGRTRFDLLPPEEAVRIADLFLDAVRRKQPIVALENVNLHQDGRRIVLETNGVPVLDETGTVTGYRGIDRDITERKQAEMENRQLEEQYRQAQKVEAIGRLAGGVAHDLNNLLSPIIGYAELLQIETISTDDRRQYQEQILLAAEGARNLVHQLLAFGRKQTLAYKPLDINETVKGFEKLIRRTLRDDIEFEARTAPDIRLVTADVGQIEQVIMNLVVNAEDAMPDGGKLTLQTSLIELDEAYLADHPGSEPGQYVRLTISDTGLGMDVEIRDQIFEPFFSTKGEQGTGLGLSTVFGIVKQHRGNIWVQSEPGRGTTFEVLLPVSAGTRVVPEPVKEAPPKLHGAETILLVEDNEQVRDLALAVLERRGYEVLVAGSGTEALALMASHQGPIQLLLTDVVMPEMNGQQLYLEATARQRDLKVLYMSGYTDDVIARRGVLDEGVAFLQKPFAIQILAAKVREVLDQDRNPAEPGE